MIGFIIFVGRRLIQLISVELAEKNLRTLKTKVKISGGFRSGLSKEELKTRKHGLAVNDYCLIMSVIQTGKLYGDNPLQVMREIISLAP